MSQQKGESLGVGVGDDIFKAIKDKDIDRVNQHLQNVTKNQIPRNSQGDPPLHYAIKQLESKDPDEKEKHKKIVAALLENEAIKEQINDKNKDKVTPLDIAVQGTKLVFIDVLVRNGADLCAQDSEGNTHLHLAIEKTHVRLVEELMKNVTSDRMPRNSLGESPLHYAIKIMNSMDQQEQKYKKIELVVQALLVNGAILCSQDAEGNTPLHVAIEENHFSLVELIMQVENDGFKYKNVQENLEINNKEGKTPKKLLQEQYKKHSETTDMDNDSTKFWQRFVDYSLGNFEKYYFMDANSLHGFIFQVKLQMFIVKTATDKKFQFSFGPEVSGAKPFDDIVIRYIYEQNEWIMRFLQAKHKGDPKNDKIKINDLLKIIKDNAKDAQPFSLKKYFNGFLKMISMPCFKNKIDEIHDLIIITNGDFDEKEFNLSECVQPRNRPIGWADFFEFKYLTSEDDLLYIKEYSTRVKAIKFKNDDKIIEIHGQKSKEEGEITKQIKKELKKLLVTKDDENLTRFFEKLVFIVNFPSENELDKFLEHKIGETFHLLDAKFLKNVFQNEMIEMIKCCKGEMARFYENKDGSELFNNMKRTMYTLRISGLSNDYIRNFQSYDIKFAFNFRLDIENWLNDSKNPILYLSTKSTLFTAIKVVQIISVLKDETNYGFLKKEDGCIFIYSEKLLEDNRQEKTIVESFLCLNDKRRLLMIECQSEHDFEEVLRLCQNSSKSMKMILIANEYESDFFFNDSNKIKDEEIGYEHLTDDAKEEVMRKEVLFQGRKVSLKKLLANDDTIASKIIDSENLFKIIDCNRKGIPYIVIGSPTGHDPFCSYGHFGKYYIKGRKLKFQNSSGQLSLEQIIVMNQKVIILSNDPGSGKSTLLTELANKLRDQCNCRVSWVIRVDLIQYANNERINCLDKYEFDTKDEATQFISNIALDESNAFEKRLFEHFDNIIVLFDGFDEISHNLGWKTKNLIKKLLAMSKISQIWITTRPCEALNLQEEFEVPVFELCNFDGSLQREFLVKYWNYRIENERNGDNTMKLNLKRLPKGNREEKLAKYADKLIETATKHDNYLVIDRDFIISVPLMLTMLAVLAFENEFNVNAMNFADVFEKFIECKLEIYARDKCKIPKGVSNVAFNIVVTTMRNIHREIGFKLIFPDLTKFLENESEIRRYKMQNECSDEDFKREMNRVGLLQPNSLEFIHRTFAEYLVCQYIIENANNENKKELIVSSARILEGRDFEYIRKLLKMQLKSEEQKNLFRRIIEKVICQREHCEMNRQNPSFWAEICMQRFLSDHEKIRLIDCKPMGRSGVHLKHFICCNCDESKCHCINNSNYRDVLDTSFSFSYFESALVEKRDDSMVFSSFIQEFVCGLLRKHRMCKMKATLKSSRDGFLRPDMVPMDTSHFDEKIKRYYGALPVELLESCDSLEMNKKWFFFHIACHCEKKECGCKFGSQTEILSSQNKDFNIKVLEDQDKDSRMLHNILSRIFRAKNNEKSHNRLQPGDHQFQSKVYKLNPTNERDSNIYYYIQCFCKLEQCPQIQFIFLVTPENDLVIKKRRHELFEYYNNKIDNGKFDMADEFEKDLTCLSKEDREKEFNKYFDKRDIKTIEILNPDLRRCLRLVLLQDLSNLVIIPAGIYGEIHLSIAKVCYEDEIPNRYPFLLPPSELSDEQKLNEDRLS